MSRRLAALVGVVMVLAGVPAGLWLLGGDPRPHQLPSLTALADWLSQPSLLVAGLPLVLLRTVLWLLWLLAAVAIMAELAGLGRRTRFLRWRITSPLHRLAAGLVGSLAGGLAVTVTGAVTQAAAPPAAAATPPADPHQPAADRSGDGQPTFVDGATVAGTVGPPVRPLVHPPTAAAAPALVYRVATDDDLGDVASRFLAAFDVYPQRSTLNGLPDPDRVGTNQALRLPGSAHDRGLQRPATGTVTASVPAPPAPAGGGPPGGPATGDDADRQIARRSRSRSSTPDHRRNDRGRAKPHPDSTPQWTINRYPTIRLTPEPERTLTVHTDTPGTATIRYRWTTDILQPRTWHSTSATQPITIAGKVTHVNNKALWTPD